MTTSVKTRARNLVLGALVADAAAMGFHWLYDQDRIAAVAPKTPEFVGPDPTHFENVPAFFAHAGRLSGAQSQYGEQAMVMARALAEGGGAYDASVYANQFRSHFGYGGKYVGYIDHATRDTLDNFRRSEDAMLIKVNAIPFDGDPRFGLAMMNKANVAIQQNSGDAVHASFEKAVRIMADDDAVVAYGFQVLDMVMGMPPVYGAVDQQLPAISKLPALVGAQTVAAVDDATLMLSVESAVRTTSDHPQSVAYGVVSANMMQAAINGADMTQVIAAGRAVANTEIDAELAKALSMVEQANTEVTKQFGMACDLKSGVPSAVHNLATTSDYTTAVRNNIYAGGDNCGRAILVGALAGAVYGVDGDAGIPQAWIDRLGARTEIDAILSKLFG